jgi:late competence protein required for DNA uptake (superfamily II DNA/RNA helicase)
LQTVYHVSQPSEFIFAMQTAPEKQEKLTASRCLVCDQAGTATKPIRRGLCRSCYYYWRVQRNALRDAKTQAKFDRELIEAGHLLESHSRSLGPPVFAEVAARVTNNGSRRP